MQRRRGQGAVEVILVVALIGIATTGATTLYGNTVRHAFATSADSIAGGASGAGNRAAMRSVAAPNTGKKTLKTFADNHLDSNSFNRQPGPPPP